MWDLRGAHSFGRLSVRNILMFAAAMLAATFVCIFLAAPAAHAADATWKGETITYNGKQYAPVEDAKENDSRGLKKGTKIYAYIEVAEAGPGVPPRKAHFIYFAPGADPPKETSATYITYDYTPPDGYKNPSGKTKIKLEPATAESKGTTSCDSTFTHGIGWIICPVTNFLADAMDTLFDIVAGFLAVRPVQTNQDNALFRAWAYMRNFANISFVIAFLIIIYSQLTSIGISNYDIKKMLPRLVIAAVLVNISYWICAVAIDISNILGYSIQDVFISIRNGLVGSEGNSWDVVSWKSISGFILSGGTAAAAVGVGGFALVAGAGGALYLLLPILLGVIMAVLVALIVMAARQAIITILVIISPLAFVAYLLPNTEKYFEKWHKLGLTMLLMFPIFSVVFGGSQLAGIAIIQNADSINLVILGMAVQVAPLAITPLLMRVSGSLLSKVGGIVNNPSKGLVDRTRKWAQERADQHKDRQLAYGTSKLANGARRIDNNRRKREGWQKSNQAMTEANWNKKRSASDIQQYAMKAALAKEGSDAAIQKRFEDSKLTNGELQNLDLTARTNKLTTDVSKAAVEANWEELRAGNPEGFVAAGALSQSALAGYVKTAKDATIDSSVEARRAHGAKEAQQAKFSEAMLASERLQERAGGIGENGADSALSAAITERRKAYGDGVNEAHQILKHLNPSADERQKIAMGETVHIKDAAGNIVKTFTEDSVYAREAAIEAQLRGEGSAEQQQEIARKSGSTLSAFKTTIGDEIGKNRLSEKFAYLGGQSINDIKQGRIKTTADYDMLIARAMATGKIKPNHLATMDVSGVANVLRVAKSGDTSGLDPALAAKFAGEVAKLGTAAKEALTNPSLSGSVASNVDPLLKEFIEHWPPPPTPPTP